VIIPAICIVGSKDSGKTTVARNLISELTRRDLRVAAAKHSHHGFNLSEDGRDTALFEEAGAVSTFFVGKNQTVCIRNLKEEEHLQIATARCAQDADILIAEGWRRSALPKVLVFLKEEKATEHEFPANVKAVVCPVRIDVDAPHFQVGQIKELADFLIEDIFSPPAEPRVTVAINGRYLPAKGFVQRFVAGGLLGMLSSLKGVEDATTIEVTIRMPEA
jgi:molybdopterin-guanine dinucleotide biosynthesis protein B